MTAQRTGAPRTARRLQAVAAALADSFWRAPVDTLPVHRDFAR
ncbi:hypothetical protein [Streptomyces sp. NPDC054987]